MTFGPISLTFVFVIELPPRLNTEGTKMMPRECERSSAPRRSQTKCLGSVASRGQWKKIAFYLSGSTMDTVGAFMCVFHVCVSCG
jgi:hypothetical protein